MGTISDEFEFLTGNPEYIENNSLYAWCLENGERGKQILEEWNVEKNVTFNGFEITPKDVCYGSDKIVWWKCPRCQKEYQLPIKSRIGYVVGCKECRTQGQSYSEMVIYYGIKEKFPNAISRCKCGDDNLEFDIVIPEINVYIEYSGEYWHSLHYKNDEKKKEYCKLNNIRFIEILEMKKACDMVVEENLIKYSYSDSKQDEMLYQILIELYKMLGIFELSVDYNKVLASAIDRMMRPVENSLVKKYPQLIEEWDSELNNGARPEYYSVSSAKRINWKCKNCGHKWDSTICNRTEFKNSCPNCRYNIFDGTIHKLSGGKPKTPLDILHSELLNEWEEQLNENHKLSEYTYDSDYVAIWKCNCCKKTWEKSIRKRVEGRSGCPRCKFNIFDGKKHTKYETMDKECPEVISEWECELNDGRELSDFISGSIYRATWKCVKCEKIWKTTITKRFKKKSACPHCGYNVFDEKIHKCAIKIKSQINNRAFL